MNRIAPYLVYPWNTFHRFCAVAIYKIWIILHAILNLITSLLCHLIFFIWPGKPLGAPWVSHGNQSGFMGLKGGLKLYPTHCYLYHQDWYYYCYSNHYNHSSNHCQPIQQRVLIPYFHLKSPHPHAFHICTTMHKILKTILFHHTWTTVRMSIPLLPRQSPPLQCYQGQVYANGQGNLHHYNNIRVHFTTLEAWPCLSAYSLPSRVSYNSWHRAGLTVLRYSPCEYATCPGF